MRIKKELGRIPYSFFEALKARDARLEPLPFYSEYKVIRKDSKSSFYYLFYSTKKALDFSKASPINLGSQYLDAHVFGPRVRTL